ncbi:MAG: GNAT family N-acetyltransferase [Clostridia bacterium]|nr:GNAT family N-acetyltransferase [Clostridia bacterium]
MDIVLRAIAPSDLDTIAALEHQSFPDPWDTSGLGLLLAPPYGGLCAWLDDTIAGYIGWLAFPAAGDMPAEAEITRIAVSPALRRRGIGRALLSAMTAQLTSDNTPLTVHLDVRESNIAAQSLYAALGFTPCGRRPRFYGEEDALEMVLHRP